MKKYLLPALAAFTLVSCAHGQTNSIVTPGRALFLKDCAHCHGADARGDDGPDLHNIDWTDDQIAKRIRTGKKGQMTAFDGKLTSDQINQLVTYVQTLK